MRAADARIRRLTSRPSTPAKFMKPGVIEPEMMPDLVEYGCANLDAELFIRETKLNVRIVEHRDAVRSNPKIVAASVGERHPFVQTEDPFAIGILGDRGAALHNHCDVLHLLSNPWR
jgi:hypothetical protein